MLTILALLFSVHASAGTLSKCQDVSGGSSASASFVPAAGEVIFFEQLSASATNATGSKGSILWDGAIIESWTGDKVITYPDNEPAFTFTGDGTKALQVKLENTSASTTYRICGILFFKTSL